MSPNTSPSSPPSHRTLHLAHTHTHTHTHTYLKITHTHTESTHKVVSLQTAGTWHFDHPAPVLQGHTCWTQAYTYIHSSVTHRHKYVHTHNTYTLMSGSSEAVGQPHLSGSQWLWHLKLITKGKIDYDNVHLFSLITDLWLLTGLINHCCVVLNWWRGASVWSGGWWCRSCCQQDRPQAEVMVFGLLVIGANIRVVLRWAVWWYGDGWIK